MNYDPLIAGSLFSGIGGLDAGLARAGWKHAFLCESDPWRRDVLRARFPGVPVYDDVRDVQRPDGRRPEQPNDAPRGREFHAGLGSAVPIDLLCGGFPCQDVSVAGQRRGLAGERSGLFHEFARIAGTLRPRWLLIENVPGLLSSNGGRDFGVVLGTLADLGYGLGWRILDSRFFGVPQRRRRVFVVGALVVDDPRAAAERAGQVLAVGSRCQGHPATRGEARADVAGTLGGGAGSRGWAQDTERMTFIAESLTKNNAGDGGWHDNESHLVANKLKSQRGIGPEETLIAAAETVRSHPRPGSNSNGNLVTHALTSEGADASEDGTGRGTPMHADGASVRRLTPRECEALQGLPRGWTNLDGTAPDSRRYAGLGDAVTATVGHWLGDQIRAAEVCA